jgi:hypothetical protein
MILRSLAFVTLLIPAVSNMRAEELWSEGRITPEQPFRARVVAVQPGWGWDTIVLKEIEGDGRYCLATFGSPHGDYKIIPKDQFDRKAMKQNGAVFLDPPIEVERFSWSMGVWRHGRIFGDDDAATKNRKKSAEEDVAPASANPSEADPEGGDKPQTESEGRSR